MTRTSNILILGAGSQARVVADIIAAAGEFHVVGFVELGMEPDRVGSEMLGIQILDTIDNLAGLVGRLEVGAAALAIGDNKKRAELLGAVREQGLELPLVIHPSAVISPHAKLGDGTVVAAQAYVGVSAELGEGGIVNSCASVDHDCKVGRCVHIAVGVHLAGAVSVGDFVTFGAGSSAVPGISVGAATTVGAGATVIHDLPENCIAVGTPARPVR